MKAPAAVQRQLLLVWLILTGLSIFMFFVAWHQGLLAELYRVDRSRICWGITLLYLVIVVHVALRVVRLSREQDLAAAVRTALENAAPGTVMLQDGRIGIAGQPPLPDCMLVDYLSDVARSSVGPRDPAAEAGAAGAELTEVYRHHLGRSHEFGWFAADLMLKLGLLGTIVGFVMMLGSVLTVEDFTAETMQGVLRNMSTGMGTALYTTFAGLVCSMLTSIQYYLLDETAAALLENGRHLSQTRLVPNLAPSGDARA
jgi:hypothetical protein